MADTIDRATLPPLFLDLAKSQARIVTSDDDALITEQLAQAIDDVERLTNATIFERTFELTSDDLASSPLWAWATPASPNWISLSFNNVSAFVATDADSVDVSDQYRLRQRDPGGVGTSYLQGPATMPAAPITFAVTAGMKTLDTIAPALRRVILRRFAALYEYREAALPLTVNDLTGEPSLWRPDL